MRENIWKSYIYKNLISKIYKEFIQLNSKTKDNLMQNLGKESK